MNVSSADTFLAAPLAEDAAALATFPTVEAIVSVACGEW